MKTGKVKFFNETKGYGFIRVDHSAEELFFHVSSTEEILEPEDRVSFEEAQGKRGPQAVNVKLEDDF